MYKQVLKFEARGNNCEAKSNEVVARFVSKGSLLKKEEKKEKKNQAPLSLAVNRITTPLLSLLPPYVHPPPLLYRIRRSPLADIEIISSVRIDFCSLTARGTFLVREFPSAQLKSVHDQG